MRMLRPIFISLVITILGSNVFGQDLPIRIVHDRIGFANVGMPISIEARLEGDLSSRKVLEAKAWFRKPTDEVYDFIDLYLFGDVYEGSISAEYVTSDGIEYYLEFTFDDNSRITFPEHDPLQNPISINVRLGEAGESPVVIISPESRRTVNTDEILIVAAFNQSIRKIDPQKIILRLDGHDQTKKAVITTEILTAVIKGQGRGRHRIDIIEHSAAGPQILATWFFTVRLQQQAPFFTQGTIHGDLSSEERYQEITGAIKRVGIQNISLNYRNKWLETTAIGRFSSEENATVQPQHRYLFTLSTPVIDISAGDLNPRYNELILWGRRVRGMEFRLGTPDDKVSVKAIFGDLARAVEGDSVAKNGTYRRWLGAAQLSFGYRQNMQFGITALKTRDQENSIDYGTAPKDNVVTGLNMIVNADHRRITLTGQTAISLYNDDISEPPLKDAEDFKDIIWINTNFVPFPDKLGEVPESEFPDRDPKVNFLDIVSSIFSKSVSYKGKLRLRYLNNDIQMGYRMINHSYYSIANPTLLRDRRGFYIRDRIRLYHSKIYLIGGFQQFNDNVGGDGDITASDRQFNVGINIYTTPGYPDIAVNYRRLLNSNDAELQRFDTQQVDSIGNHIYRDIDLRKDDQTNYWTFNLFESIPFTIRDFNTYNEINASVITSDRDDVYDTLRLAKSEQMTYSLSLKTMYDNPLTTFFSYSSSTQKGMNDRTDVIYNTISTRFDYKFFNRKLLLYFGPRFTTGSGTNNLSPFSPSFLATLNGEEPNSDEVLDNNHRTVENMLVDFLKTDWIGGFRYDFLKNHIIAGYLSVTQYKENSRNQYYSGDEYGVNETTVTFTKADGTPETFTQPGANINRDDIMATITYTYKF